MKELRRKIYLFLTVTLAVTLAVSTIHSSPSHATEFEEIIVFGDSLSDTGNLYLATGMTFPESPPYDEGRFSNGLVWVEYLALGLGMNPPLPSNFGGTNYSWGGAETGYGLSAQGTPNIGEQINDFFGNDPTDSNVPNEKQLIIIWAGSNDFNNFDLISPYPRDLRKLVKDIVGNITEHIMTLALSSPEEELQFLVPNLPPLGQTARAQCLGEDNPFYPLLFDGLSAKFNIHLFIELKKLKRQLKKQYDIKVKIYRLDVFRLTKEILIDPEPFGFTNIRDTARIGTNAIGCPLDVTAPDQGVVDNADEYVFFDDVHPTTTFHKALADRALEIINDKNWKGVKNIRLMR